ncbi:MAG: outer membrane protein assembly factor BamD [Gemmatimonadetes bacterium]|nr:outer membrane protein assembly factor BamD [Gemmatimonadota bacterium]
MLTASIDVSRIRTAATGVLLSCLSAACSSTPAYTGWTPDQLYEHGEQAFGDGDFGEARRAFERLVLTFPGYERAVDARHYLAQAFFRDEEYLSAVSEFTRIVQVFPDHTRSAEAWMGLCRSYAALSPHPQRDQQYTFQARTTCQNVANDFRGQPEGDSANAVASAMHAKLAEKLYAEGHFYFQRDIYESAELIFIDLLAQYGRTPAAPKAAARLIEIYDEWGWEEQRAEFTTRLLNQYPDSPEAQALAAPVAADTTSTVRSRAPPAYEAPGIRRTAR